MIKIQIQNYEVEGRIQKHTLFFFHLAYLEVITYYINLINFKNNSMNYMNF